MANENDGPTMSDRIVPKHEEEENNILVGGSIQSENERLIDEDLDNDSLELLYRGNELAFRLITKWSQDPVEKGFSVEAIDEDIDLDEAVDMYRQKLEFDSKLMELNKQVNTFGSAEFGYDLVDSAGSPEQGVNPEDVEDITGINIVRQDHIESYDLDDNGEIEYIDLEADLELDRIHSDRIQHARYYGIRGHPEGFGLLHPLYTSLKVFENVKFGMGQAFYVGGTGFPIMRVQNLDSMKDNDVRALKQDFMTDVLKNPGMMVDDEKAEIEFKGSQGKALDPDPYISSLLDMISSVVGSKQILTGAIPGGVEGSEVNKEEYFGDVSSFQQNKLNPIVRDFVNRLIDYGLVPEPENGYRVEWHDLFEKSEETHAEISETKSKAFLNLTSSGVPPETAAEEVGLSDELIEDLTDGSDPENPESPQGSEGTEPETGSEYDRDQTRELIEYVKQDEMSPEIYADSIEGFDQEIRKPTTWRDPVYQNYMDLRKNLLDRYEEFLDRVIEGVETARISTDRGIIQKIRGDEPDKLDKRIIERRLEVETDKLQQDLQDTTRTSLQTAFTLGAERGAEVFNESLSEVFDKHRRELLDETFDKYVTDAYAGQTQKVNDKINERVKYHFNNQDHGIGDLKRDIRDLHDAPDAEDWRFDRIARTETGRIRNMGYIDETSRRGRNLYEWIGPTDQRTTQTCLDIKSGNPYTKKQLLDVTSGGSPHINCRHTAGVSTDAILGDQKVDVETLQKQYEQIEIDAGMERLDEAHAKFRAAVNMDAGEFRRWTEGSCTKLASNSRKPAERVGRLKRKNKSNWDEEDITDALRVWNFVNRMLGQEPESPRDGPEDCDSKWAIALKNWGHNPFSEDGGSVSLNQE